MQKNRQTDRQTNAADNPSPANSVGVVSNSISYRVLPSDSECECVCVLAVLAKARRCVRKD